MSAPILLLLGAGPNIGQAVAKAFAAKGYKVALASRTPRGMEGDQVHITADFSQPESVSGVFESVKQKLGGSPSVVVYNAAYAVFDDAKDPFSSFDIAKFNTSLAINVQSPMVAIQESIKAFRSLPSSASKTFIFTGNILNEQPIPGMMTFAVSKAAPANAIENAVKFSDYAKEGISLYYTDERNGDGSPANMNISGEAAAIEYVRLAEAKEQGPWQNTFVKGQGYKHFAK